MMSIQTPRCCNMSELPDAALERAQLPLKNADDTGIQTPTLLQVHLAHGLAYTAGSALGFTPPSVETCLASFLVPNKAGLTTGARAWSKHFHRSMPLSSSSPELAAQRKASSGWWGVPSGPVSTINERALNLFRRIVVENATWRNLH